MEQLDVKLNTILEFCEKIQSKIEKHEKILESLQNKGFINRERTGERVITHGEIDKSDSNENKKAESFETINNNQNDYNSLEIVNKKSNNYQIDVNILSGEQLDFILKNNSINLSEAAKTVEQLAQEINNGDSRLQVSIKDNKKLFLRKTAVVELFLYDPTHNKFLVEECNSDPKRKKVKRYVHQLIGGKFNHKKSKGNEIQESLKNLKRELIEELGESLNNLIDFDKIKILDFRLRKYDTAFSYAPLSNKYVFQFAMFSKPGISEFLTNKQENDNEQDINDKKQKFDYQQKHRVSNQEHYFKWQTFEKKQLWVKEKVGNENIIKTKEFTDEDFNKISDEIKKYSESFDEIGNLEDERKREELIQEYLIEQDVDEHDDLFDKKIFKQYGSQSNKNYQSSIFFFRRIDQCKDM